MFVGAALSLAASACVSAKPPLEAPRVPVSPPPPGRPEPPPPPPEDPFEPEVAPGPWTLKLPRRKKSAETGSQFISRTAELKPPEFEPEVLKAVMDGNIPSFLRTFVTIRIDKMDQKARLHKAIIHVLPDYLAIGSDADFIRMPMTPATAQSIANATDSMLPTCKLVDEIYRQAPNKLPPKWIDGGPNAENHWDYDKHNKAVEEQRSLRRLQLGVLMAGHMKDIVICNDLLKHENKVAIYGWHREGGKPIQPLTTVHSKRYADYSHGVRLISQTILLDEQERRAGEILRDKLLAPILSDDGPLRITAYAIS